MSEGLKLHILSPERRLVEGLEISELTLPTSDGEIQILPGHAHLVGQLGTGMFSYRPAAGGETHGAFSTGFFEVRGDAVFVMAETLELKGEIDVERAKKAQRRAEEVLSGADFDEHRFRKYQLKMQRSLIRQQVVDRQ